MVKYRKLSKVHIPCLILLIIKVNGKVSFKGSINSIVKYIGCNVSKIIVEIRGC